MPAVLAVKVAPKTAFPVMATLPDNVALSVEMEAVALADDAKCVSVSLSRALNE